MLRALAAATLAAAALALAPRPAAGATRFYPVELFVDAGGAPLGAWQAELTFAAPQLAIVGIEGGDPPFVDAPYHDPRGLETGRLVVAAFTLGAAPHAGPVRVARIHLADRGGGEARIAARLLVAADQDGNAIEARIEVAGGKEGPR